jgi:diguanylate cyclase (GGDEF)-like protein
MRLRILLQADGLTLENRWQLVSSLFAQGRSVDSALALTVVIAVCWSRTGWAGFAWLGGWAALATCVTLVQNRAFSRFRRTAFARPRPGSPERWAAYFLGRICLLASAWAALDVVLFLGFDDPALQFFATTLQAAWLAGAAARNAASPAGVVLPMLLILLPLGVEAGFAADHFARVLVPCAPLVFNAMLSIARYIGRQTVASMQAEHRLAELNAQLMRLSTTDGLTGIGNRRCFDTALRTEWAGAIRDGSALALLMLDVDYFKRYNDRYGHLQGDECLRTVALCSRIALQRPADLLTRYGGEEFAVLLPATDITGAEVVAERLRRAVYEARLPHLDSPFGRVSISVGIACLVPTAAMPAQDLLSLADQALYQAKRDGRNCTRSAGERPCETVEVTARCQSA